MKKIVITMALAALVSTTYGQGFVSVAGNQSDHTNLTVITTGWAGGFLASGTEGALGNLASGQSYHLALLSTTASSPVTTLFGDASLATDWSYTGLLGGNGTFAGRLNIGAGLQTTGTTGPIGVSVNWVLVGWSSNLGTSWALVEAQLAGGAFTNTTPGFLGWTVTGAGAAAGAAPALPTVIQGAGGVIPNTAFTLLTTPIVPEPATLALVGLGGLALLAFRRRQ
jgi:hypothetical protein